MEKRRKRFGKDLLLFEQNNPLQQKRFEIDIVVWFFFRQLCHHLESIIEIPVMMPDLRRFQKKFAHQRMIWMFGPDVQMP